MYGKSVINRINNNGNVVEPLEVLASVGLGSLQEVPHLPKADGFRAVGEPLKVSVEPSFAAPDALPLARNWIRETGAQFVAFVSKGATIGELQAFEPVGA